MKFGLDECVQDGQGDCVLRFRRQGLQVSGELIVGQFFVGLNFRDESDADGGVQPLHLNTKLEANKANRLQSSTSSELPFSLNF